MRLVLIDSRIYDIANITNSFTTDVEYLIFEWFGGISAIQQKITKSYDTVAIIQYNYAYNAAIYQLVYDTSFATVENLATVDPSLNSWNQYVDFLIWLKNERGANYIDLMACGLWASADWRYMIETVRATYGIYIRASIDVTGEGGNFILESDNFDTIGVYFTENILQYKYNFYPYFNAGYIVGYTNYTPYTLPPNNLAKMSNRYAALLGNYPSATYSNVVSVVTNNQASAILRGDGSVVVMGNPVHGGSMPSGIVTQSQLVNVTKIVSSNNCFAALKSDGSVISWGSVNQWTNADINNYVDATLITVNSIRSQLTNVVDLTANAYDTFAALTSAGAVVTWGFKSNGADKGTAATFLSSGVKKVYAGVDNFVAIKTDGTGVNWGGYSNGGPYLSTTYFTNSTPIVDVFINPYNFYHLYIRQNGTTYDVIPSNFTSAAYYTLPVGTKILKKCAVWFGSNYYYFLVLDNSTVVRIQTTGNATATVTTYSNATDVTVNGQNGAGAYGLLQNGNLTVNGTSSYGGVITDTTYGLKSGVSVTDGKIVRLVSSYQSIGAIKSDNTFVWIGLVNIPYVTNYNSSTFPTNAAQTTLYNATRSNIANVYPCYDGYMISDNSGNFAMLGTRGYGTPYFNYSSTNYGVKDANTNVFFELAPEGWFAFEIPYLPTVTPATITASTKSTVSYYVSNPDLMGYLGRKYTLYNGATLVDTFYPTQDTNTYTFSNVILVAGVYTLTIKDETSTSYTVTSFQLTSENVYPCFLEGSKILCLDPDTYRDEYIAVEKLRPGDLVATAESGYRRIHSIGYKTICNPKTDPNPSGRLYKFSPKSIKEIFETLYITGEHCTLHREIPEYKRAQITEHMGDVYITEEFYRVPARFDDRAEEYDGADDPATIWHFALEHENVTHNYGVWANGLLVESCAIESLLEKSGMKLLE